MMTRLNFVAVFNTDVDADKVFLSPGGFEFRNASGKIMEFDFTSFAGNIDKQDRKQVVFNLKTLDTDAFPDSKEYSLTDIGTVTEVSEFYMDIYFTDNQPHPEFELTAIKDISIEFYETEQDMYKSICIPDVLITEELIQDINQANQ